MIKRLLNVRGKAQKEEVGNKRNTIYFTILSWAHALSNYTFGALVISVLPTDGSPHLVALYLGQEVGMFLWSLLL